MNKYVFLTMLLLPAQIIASVADTDSVKNRTLNEVTVSATLQRASSESTTYLPTSRQKNASQSGTQLLLRMGITQLNIDALSNEVTTVDGRPVAIYIDYVPADAHDLKGMRTSDVRKVEYLDYPTDPRFQGNEHVINFIMVKYEYGGYAKVSGQENAISNTGNLQVNSRLQYKRMTYDMVGSGNYVDSKHLGKVQNEIYRLPQTDGSVKTFNRQSRTTTGRLSEQQYNTILKAAYRSKNITAINQISYGINNNPHRDYSGMVTYNPDYYPASDFNSSLDIHSDVMNYNGNFYFALPDKTTISFIPTYTYSHSDENSAYAETGLEPNINAATDHTHQAKAQLSVAHPIGIGQLSLSGKLEYENNLTHYSGTSTATNHNVSIRYGIGAYYRLKLGKVFTHAGIGGNFDRITFNKHTERISSPWASLSLQYAPSRKQKATLELQYFTYSPSSNAKSPTVIRETPFMSYTGNPDLVPFRSYYGYAGYLLLPSNKFSLNMHAKVWTTPNRYVYDYEASPTGILRTIRQPMGNYVWGQAGVKATSKLCNNRLQLTAKLLYDIFRNGAPYNFTKSAISYELGAFYYLNNFNFAIAYTSAEAQTNGSMSGEWANIKSRYYIQAGWNNARWNIQLSAFNFARWNWRSRLMTLHSQYYDTSTRSINTNDHAMIRLSATFTFGFGKKIGQDNEPYSDRSVPSGILR
ncbi:MAG: outer membrane beta-barrel family protein [Muribaculaceae bacterium]|nr:outer membrane beta-barrel family protein [Muribaculaceae bacterium]